MWFLLIYLIIGALFVYMARKPLTEGGIDITVLHILVWAALWPIYLIAFIYGIIIGCMKANEDIEE